jgi:hypothetical protein
LTENAFQVFTATLWKVAHDPDPQLSGWVLLIGLKSLSFSSLQASFFKDPYRKVVRRMQDI